MLILITTLHYTPPCLAQHLFLISKRLMPAINRSLRRLVTRNTAHAKMRRGGSELETKHGTCFGQVLPRQKAVAKRADEWNEHNERHACMYLVLSCEVGLWAKRTNDKTDTAKDAHELFGVLCVAGMMWGREGKFCGK
jgi:hypothetical protein